MSNIYDKIDEVILGLESIYCDTTEGNKARNAAIKLLELHASLLHSGSSFMYQQELADQVMQVLTEEDPN